MNETKQKTKYYKHPKFGHVYGQRTATPFGRAAWPSLVTPKDPPPPEPGQAPGQARYELTLLLDKTSDEVKQFVTLMKTMTQEMLELFNKGRAAKLSADEPFKDGDAFDLEKYPYYKNNWVLVARNVKKPKVLDGKKREIGSDMVEGGNICLTVVTPLVTAHGISYKLDIVQYVRDDGVKFAGAVAPAESYLDVLEGVDEGLVDEVPVQNTEKAVKENAAKSQKEGKELALETL